MSEKRKLRNFWENTYILLMIIMICIELKNYRLVHTFVYIYTYNDDDEVVRSSKIACE